MLKYFSNITGAQVSLDTSIFENKFLFSTGDLTEILFQKDGKFLTGGELYSSPNSQLIFRRYNSDGSLDSSFSGDGSCTISIPGYSYEWPQKMYVQENGKILVTAGLSRDGDDRDIALLRLNKNGSLDTSFGTNGMSVLDIGLMERASKGIVQLPDGKILVGGKYNEKDNSEEGEEDYFVLRFSADGKYDTSFGENGVVNFGSHADLDLVETGKVLIFDTSYSSALKTDIVQIARYNLDRTIDTSYGSGGTVTVSTLNNLTNARHTCSPEGECVFLLKYEDQETHEFQYLSVKIDSIGKVLYRKYLQINYDEENVLSEFFSNEDSTIELLDDNRFYFSSYSAETGSYSIKFALISDTINGTSDKDSLNGTPGHDIIKGLSQNDTLIGYAGNDTLNGGTGADTMTGGLGNDTYYVDNTGDKTIESSGTGTGIDTVKSSIAWTLGANVEKLLLTGTTAINGTGNTLVNTLTGNSDANILSGLAGADNLQGNSGNDILNGGTGADSMTGGLGNDTYYVDNTGDKTIESSGTGTGIDTVKSSIAWTLGANVENLILTGTTAINGTGNTLANTLTGNSDANILSGLAGADNLQGNSGNDILNGGTGADSMTGGLGNE